MLDTPLGPITVSASEDAVCEILLGGETPTAVLRNGGLALEATRQLGAYLRGKRRAFDLPLRLRATPFTARVLAEVEAIPHGETRSYGDIARAIGKPRAARAVGQAVGANPLPLLIPCHRVLAAGNAIGGFGGGLRWKRFLLDLEGISYRDVPTSRG